MKKSIHLLGISILMAFSLACGSSASTASTASDGLVEVTGTVNASLANQKPRFTGTTTSNVMLTNIETGEVTAATVIGSNFSARVKGGIYEITSDLEGNNLSKVITANNYGSFQTLAGNVDLTSSAIVKYARQVAGTNDLRAIDDIANFVTVAEAIINNQTSITSLITVTDTVTTLRSQINLLRIEMKNNYGNSIDAMAATYDIAGTLVSASNLNLQAAYNNSYGAEVAVVMTKPSDYTGVASVAIVDTDSYLTKTKIATYTASDYSLTSYGRQFYSIGRFGSDSVQRYDIGSPSTELYPTNFSVLSAGETSINPHDIIFASKSKALLTRYGSNVQWMVNPSANVIGNFKIAEIDLSIYDRSDNIAECSKGVYVKDKFFVTAQRLDRNDGWAVKKSGYVIVLDKDGVEIDTSRAEANSGLKGIALTAMNPQDIMYNSATGLIYVLCSGPTYSNLTFTSAIISIDPTTYETKIIVDDDTGLDASTTDTSTGTYGGTFNDLAIVDSTHGFLTTYATVENTYTATEALRAFNPSTGSVGNVISGFSGIDIRSLDVDSKGNLWISTTDGITVMKSSDNSIIQTVSASALGQIPDSLTFIKY